MSGVSVAEKRALLEAAGKPWPVCDCHGEPKRWNSNTNKYSGGSWRCPNRHRESSLNWANVNRETRRDWQREQGRRQRGWYDEGGMATVPARARSLA